METRVILHIDFDYFYAQCEEIRKPELRTKPVCVCIFSDRGGDSGAIATANYKARDYGVKSGIPIKFAKKKLEEIGDAVFLPADFEFYSEISEKAMEIIKSYADVFEYVGRDEAFLEVTKKTEENFEKAGHLAQQIKNSIREKLKLTCSIGVSPNKLLAKIASDFKKPDGLTVIPPEKINSFLEPLAVKKIPGIGKKTEEKLNELDIKTIGELKKIDVFTLTQMFGKKTGTYIFNSAKGIDEDIVKERGPSIQFSKIVTLPQNSKDFEYLKNHLEKLCDELHKIILNHNKMFKSVGIQFVQTDLSNKTKSKMLKNSTTSLDELKKTSILLLKTALEDQSLDVRRLGVKVSEFTDIEGQSSLTNYF